MIRRSRGDIVAPFWEPHAPTMGRRFTQTPVEFRYSGLTGERLFFCAKSDYGRRRKRDRVSGAFAFSGPDLRAPSTLGTEPLTPKNGLCPITDDEVTKRVFSGKSDYLAGAAKRAVRRRFSISLPGLCSTHRF